TTTYTVIAVDANGCSSAAQTVTVLVNPPLTIVAATTVPTCIGTVTELHAQGAGGNGGPYTYAWLPGGQTGNTISVSPPVTTTYTVTVTDNCTNPAAVVVITVKVYGLPSIVFTADTPAACGKLCAQFTSSSPGVQSMIWSFGDGGTASIADPKHCYTLPGIYSVKLTVTDTNGCTNSLTHPNMLTVYSNPVAQFTMGPQPTTILDPHICFTDHSTPDVNQWYWNFDDSNDPSTSSQQNPCHAYTDTGTYCATLIVHNANGCWNTISECLVIQPYFTLYVPNAFTPNDDGLNDVFLPLGINLDKSTYTLMIFDRWGEEIFETHTWGEGWDGRANGGALVSPIGVYVWRIKVKDYAGGPHLLVGSVSLIK
ncbi:MAG TPA: PKD domain-containing protein, partial [Bacteroidia bacterium]|nr:PKD domain-containing protein [Bacteroidia bacterium]